MNVILKFIFYIFIAGYPVVFCLETGSHVVTRSEPKDGFREIYSNISADKTKEEIAEFLSYSCEIMVVITNEAQKPIRLRCSSKTTGPENSTIARGNSLVFTFKPHVDGSSDFWCNLRYEHLWIKFDAYTEDQPYICPNKKKLYRYSVRHDGLYADPEVNGGNKIRSLFMGHNKFQLWEHYDVQSGHTDGSLVTGFVDGGMCSELPDHIDDRAAVVTVCKHQCLLAYDFKRCTGDHQRLQAEDDGCTDFVLESNLRFKVSALKGC